MKERPDEEVYRARSGRIPNPGTSVPMELSYVTLSRYTDMFTNPEALEIPYCCNFYGTLHIGVSNY